MEIIKIVKSVLFFVLAGLCEIGGGYLVWLWLREGKNIWYGLSGAIVLVIYGVIPTFQPATLLAGSSILPLEPPHPKPPHRAPPPDRPSLRRCNAPSG